MKSSVSGIHHITAISGNALRNHRFYTEVMGLRFLKKTVNFDDPTTYHFYYGDQAGTPGTILTFFPWEGISKGRHGTGMATDISYAVPADSVDFWSARVEANNMKIKSRGTRFGEPFLSFEDPDGLMLSLITPAEADSRKPWETSQVTAATATRGFHSVSITLSDTGATAGVLTDVLGYSFERQEGDRYRFRTTAVPYASVVDLVVPAASVKAVQGSGTIHHVAFRVRDEATLMDYRHKIMQHGLQVTPKIDRTYFFSIYFREPGGVLFELATDNPGFTADEPLESLGTHLKLPARYESRRAEIESKLPPL